MEEERLFHKSLEYVRETTYQTYQELLSIKSQLKL